MSSWLYTVVGVSPRIGLRPYANTYVEFVARVTQLRIEYPSEVVALGSWFDGWCETFRELGMSLPDEARVLDWERGGVNYQIYCFSHNAATELGRRAVVARRTRPRGLNSYAVNTMIPTLRGAAIFAHVCGGEVLIAVKNIGASLGDSELGNGRLPNELFRPTHDRASRR